MKVSTSTTILCFLQSCHLLTSDVMAFTTGPAALLSRPSSVLFSSSESNTLEKTEVTDRLDIYSDNNTKKDIGTQERITVTLKQPVPQRKTSINKRPTSAAATASKNHKDGIFSPMVRFFKRVLGDEKLNEIRAKAISYHSNTIKTFVSVTSDTRVGLAALEALFQVADRNRNGQIEEEELQDALRRLGFKWLKEKQVHGIFERAGGADKGYLTLNEFLAEAPKTLKTNLVKLAKTNGGELGFLV